MIESVATDIGKIRRQRQKSSAYRSRPRVLGHRHLGRFFLYLALILGLTACKPSVPPIDQATVDQAIVGQWSNPQGGIVYFYADKSGFIPGNNDQTPAIPSAKFTYSLRDQTHLHLQIEGQSAIEIQIALDGDTLTWFTPINNTQFIYTRVE